MTLTNESGPIGRIAEARAIESVHNALQCSKATRTVADHAADADDCRKLLEMLGLDPTMGKRE